MALNEPLLKEIDHEAATTRKLLERVPDQQFGWKPHEKSMTLGRLAAHISELPGLMGVILDQDEFDIATRQQPAQPTTHQQVLQTFDANIGRATDLLGRQTDQRLLAVWRFKRSGQVLMEMPRIAILRFVGINHMIHHRGQLSVYLRLQNVPIPSIYGPSADEPM